MSGLRPLYFAGLVLAIAAGIGFSVVSTAPKPNVATPTLGGKQVWSDEYFDAGWRIQQNVITGHYRLLDGEDIRRAWGTYEECRSAHAGYRGQNEPVPAARHLVLLVHGLGRSAGMFDDLAEALRADGFTPVAVNYASSRESIADHADHLARLIAGLEGVDRISFVTHSMGGLVVRALLAHPDLVDTGISFDRVVMIAPPSRGSAIARTLKDVAIYHWLTTETGQDLTPEGAKALPLPAVEFAIIAGGRGDGKGFNPLLEGDDDGVVTVEETRLEGARDFLVVPSPHGLVDNHPVTISAVRTFLATGRFTPSQS